MLVIPAVDIKDGKCVRLAQGKAEKETIYSEDPALMALKWQEIGAEFLHVVDLDGAFRGHPVNIDAIKAILERVSIPVELGGGIREESFVETFFSMGINRIIIGSAAINSPEMVKRLCRKYPQRIAVSIDAKDGKVAIKGWVEKTTIDAIEVAKRCENWGVGVIIYTDILRDGMQSGVNIKAIQNMLKEINIPLIVAGGVSTLKDIHNLLPLEKDGLIGVITGKALYEGSLNLKEAIKITKKEKDKW
ncbi:MAG: 1-(5-phosphoribosyl)-5-[(5-phosphoribosylamino)methylideneamino]imidazole-4-carboxamide isomerase [Deltaproteobacteria bacterium]|nr:1-(5-phosphoribosyl)-5-[(5-phosphoribosylamino)methylideneamino]imidazole-4-carboxamide isomerase [Deltaproteobacteria bacterium]